MPRASSSTAPKSNDIRSRAMAGNPHGYWCETFFAVSLRAFDGMSKAKSGAHSYKRLRCKDLVVSQWAGP